MMKNSERKTYNFNLNTHNASKPAHSMSIVTYFKTEDECPSGEG